MFDVSDPRTFAGDDSTDKGAVSGLSFLGVAVVAAVVADGGLVYAVFALETAEITEIGYVGLFCCLPALLGFAVELVVLGAIIIEHRRHRCSGSHYLAAVVALVALIIWVVLPVAM